MRYLIIIAALIATQAFGHPGRTDEFGWHTNSVTGEYHAHRKKPYDNVAKNEDSGWSSKEIKGKCTFNNKMLLILPFALLLFL